jgi:hypothetical protein
MINPASTINIPPEVLYQELSGESVLLNLSSGKYYGLDEVGTRIWTVLTEHRNINDALNILLDEYDVDQERLSKDMILLIEDLVKNGLIQIDSQENC